MYHLNVKTADEVVRVGVKGRRKAETDYTADIARGAMPD